MAVGLSPYRVGPDALGPSSYANGVSHVWMHTHAPYGPLFIGLAGLVGGSVHSATMAFFEMRALALVGLLLLAIWLPRLAEQHGIDPGVAIWAGLLNPLTVLNFVGGGHNDALMLGLLIAGLALAGDGRWRLAVAACAVAAAVKAPAAIALPFVVADVWATRAVTPRWRSAIEAAAIALGTFGAITLVTGAGWGWVGALTTPGKVRTILAPVTALAAGVGLVAPRLVTLAVLVRLSGIAAGAAAMLVALRRRATFGTARSFAFALAAFVTLGPVVHAWYLLWAFVPLAAVGVGFMGVIVWVSATVPFLVLPNGSIATDFVLVTYLALTALVVPHLLRLERSRRLSELPAD
jgi:hypothetical protein